jgi:hypothetical protein
VSEHCLTGTSHARATTRKCDKNYDARSGGAKDRLADSRLLFDDQPFHLMVETPEANLMAGMKWFLGIYTSRFISDFG